MKLQPLQDRVLVKRIDGSESMRNGIYIPDSAREKPQEGEVVAVGPGKPDQQMGVSIGDRILFGKYSGSEIRLDDQEYLILREEEILGVLQLEPSKDDLRRAGKKA